MHMTLQITNGQTVQGTGVHVDKKYVISAKFYAVGVPDQWIGYVHEDGKQVNAVGFYDSEQEALDSVYGWTQDIWN